MDQKVLNEAVENISLIRGVIDRTSKSFTAFSKIFIYWGLLFIVNSIITVVMNSNKEIVLDILSRYPLLGYIFHVGIIALPAALIYINVSKKIPLVGLEKHLMKVWMLILIMNVIPAKIMVQSASYGVDIKTVSVQVSNFSIIFFSLAIALITTSLFTEYKRLMYLGIIYIAISLLYAYLHLQIFDDTLIQVLSLLSLPFTFLYTGFFLKSRQARGN